MTETLRQQHTTETPDRVHIPDEVRNRIIDLVSRQPGDITPEELEQALSEGWNYGHGLINGYKPEHNLVADMARTICGLGRTACIETNHFIPVSTAVDAAAREAKRALHSDGHKQNTTGIELTTDI